MESSAPKKRPSVFIETYGCQMNKCDSELISGLLKEKGCSLACSLDEADVVLVNTCSVREHAEKRVWGRLSALTDWKRKAPGRKLGVIGCMGQRLGADLLEKRPDLDFVVGPDRYRDLPGLMDGNVVGSCIRTESNPGEVYDDIRAERRSGTSGWVAVSRGCDNFCSYCIVPYTRGRERSRSSEKIVDELVQLAGLGFREVTLLGQNVNSYYDGLTDFAGLLERAALIDGLLRIRFMTSHPKDLSDKLLQVMARGGRICPHIHLPVQSGSNRVLEAMNRKVTAEQITDLIDKARETVSGLAVTTDMMVGFPGETDADFLDTCRLLEKVRFDEAYTYAYSPRTGTRAAEMPETVPGAEKSKRLDRMIQIQRGISLEIKRGMIGSTVAVLPECPSRKSDTEWMGRTPSNHVVVFPKENASAGEIITVRIEACKGATLWGRIVETPSE
jgi:tRNA-2-methylthio-N6-dimethylallyladenosine synthase